MSKAVLKDASPEKMYILGMKKAIALILILTAFAAALFAQGTPEEQRQLFENLMYLIGKCPCLFLEDG